MPEMIWLQTDERVEAEKALEMLRHTLTLVENDIYYWKWAIIALDNLIQVFMACAVGGPAGLGALKPKIAKGWMQAILSQGRSYLPRRLDDFSSLFARVKKQYRFNLSAEVEYSIRRMRDFRNQFAHFAPSVNWSLEVNDLPKLFKNCLHLVDLIAWDSAKMLWIERDMKERAKEHYDAVLGQLDSLQAHYNS